MMKSSRNQRPSAISVGVFSIVFVLLELILMLAFDVPTIIGHFRTRGGLRRRRNAIHQEPSQIVVTAMGDVGSES